MDTLDSDSPDPTPGPRRSHWLRYALALLLLAAAGLGAYQSWQAWRPVVDDALDLSPEALDSRLLDAEQALTAMRRGQQTVEQRLTDTQARTGLLRDEVLAVGERAVILEDNLRKLSAAARDSRDALRLDEAELLLSLAQSRLTIAGDLDGAIRAAVLADGALASLTDPALVNLRQTLADELAALRALPADPRKQAQRDLDALEAALPTLAANAPAAPVRTGVTSGLQRLLDALVQVRPSAGQDLLSPGDRATGEAALALELALARSAVERRDEDALRASLKRLGGWLGRLYVAGPALAARQRELDALASRPLQPQWPDLGAALAQVRALRRQTAVER